MLFSRGPRAKSDRRDDGGGSGRGPTAEAGQGESGDPKTTRREPAVGSEHGVIEQAGDRCVVGFGGEDGGLKAVVVTDWAGAGRRVSHSRGLSVKMRVAKLGLR